MVAQTTRGNITAGDNLARADAAPGSFPLGYASDQITETVAVLVNAVTSYAGAVTAAGLPLRPFKTSVTFTVASVVRTLEDARGDGTLVGAGGDFGTINYTTGAITIETGAAQTPGVGDAGNAIAVTYATDFAQQTEIPKIVMRLTTKSVK